MKRIRQFPGLGFGAVTLAALLFVLPATNLLAGNKLNVNTATKKELAQIPGISKELAKLIVQYRKEEGPIENWETVLLLMREAEIRKLEKHLKLGPQNQDN